MALVVMYHHFRKQQKKSEIAKAWYESCFLQTLYAFYLFSLFLLHLLLFFFLLSCRHWIRVIAMLVMVMGMAWIANILFFDVNLLFIAYIMTIFIAGQGIIIFILFIPLSKQVWKVKNCVRGMCLFYFSWRCCLFNVCRWGRHTSSGGTAKYRSPHSSIDISQCISQCHTK